MTTPPRARSRTSQYLWPCFALSLALARGSAGAPALALPPAGEWSPVVEEEIGRVPGPGAVGDLRAVGLGRDRFLVVWDRPVAGRELVARPFDARGRSVGEEILITPGAGWPTPHDVMATPDGGAVVAYSAFDAASEAYHVQLRRLAPDGATLGPTRQVDERESHEPTYPAVAVAPDGRLLVVWQTRLATAYPGFTRLALAARWLDGEGLPTGAETELLDSPYPWEPHVAADPGGGFLLTWAAGSVRQHLDPAGARVGQATFAPPEAGAEHRLLATASGVFGAYSAVLGMACTEDPDCVVPETTVARLDGPPSPHVWVTEYGTSPELAVHPSGATLAVWQGAEAGRRWLAADGSAATPAEILTLFDEAEVAAAHDGRGDLFVAWASVRHDVEPNEPVVLSTQVFQVDTDGDGIVDVDDACPELADPAQLDADGDGIGAACDCDETDPENHALCLGAGGRYRATVEWTAQGASGRGWPLPLTVDSGAFWFFAPENLELLIKVLDGCALGGHHWVFAAGLTDVATAIRVEDRTTGASVAYRTAAGLPFPPLHDTAALPCP